MAPRLCPYCRKWELGSEAACAVCRTALRFIQLAESPSCGATEHQWLSKELAKLLGEACTRLLLSPSSPQEGRGRSPLARRSSAKGPPSDSQEDPRSRDRSPLLGGPSSGFRGDTTRPRGTSPPAEQERWRPSLRLTSRGPGPLIAAARTGVSRDYLSQAREVKSGRDERGVPTEIKGTTVSKSRPHQGERPPAEKKEDAPAGGRAPVTPPSPPPQRRRQEVKGKGKTKGKQRSKDDGEPIRRKKKNKGLKRGAWWQGYLESRAARRARTERGTEVDEEGAEEESAEEVNEPDTVISERLARWSDATEEAGT